MAVILGYRRFVSKTFDTDRLGLEVVFWFFPPDRFLHLYQVHLDIRMSHLLAEKKQINAISVIIIIVDKIRMICHLPLLRLLHGNHLFSSHIS